MGDREIENESAWWWLSGTRESKVPGGGCVSGTSEKRVPVGGCTA
jgi:hypothetical protein